MSAFVKPRVSTPTHSTAALRSARSSFDVMFVNRVPSWNLWTYHEFLKPGYDLKRRTVVAQCTTGLRVRLLLLYWVTASNFISDF